MANYAKPLATDAKGNGLQEYPAPFTTTSRTNDDNAVPSSVISLNPNTTTIEVGATGGQGVVIRWVPKTETAAVAPFGSVIASGAGANFDHWIPPATYRRFVLPIETGGNAGGQAGSMYGLYGRLAISNAGTSASSVLLSEF